MLAKSQSVATTLRRATCRGLATTTPLPPTTQRGAFPHFEIRQTRWNDTDGFGHINNAIYYQLMDDAVNLHLFERGIGRAHPRFIAENGIRYFRPLTFPQPVHVGIGIANLGKSSVTYQVGFFHDDDDDNNNTAATAAALGKFVHVYVNETTGQPVPIPTEARQVMQDIMLLLDDDTDEDS